MNFQNNYFVYDAGGFSNKQIEKLAKKLEESGYIYHRYTELGGAPEVEQLIIWLHNHQFISGIAAGVLANYFYDIIKNLNVWYKSNRPSKSTVPIVEIFIHLKDLNKTRADLSIRFDKELSKRGLEGVIKKQIRFYRSVSDKENKCVKCGQVIHPHQVYYFESNRIKFSEPICIFCKRSLEK